MNAEFYIAPDGNDTWSGTLPHPDPTQGNGPFATLTRARDAVRELLRKDPDGHVTVLIRGGRYVLRETVVFATEDGTERGSVTWRAFGDEVPVFTSAVPITGWRKVEEDPAGVPPAARGRLWVADVSADLDRFYTLYDGGGRLPRARTAGFEASESPSREKLWEMPRDVLEFPEGALRNWDRLDDVEIVIRPTHQWVMNILPLASVDEESGTARTTIPGTYPLSPARHTATLTSCWVENVFEGLDSPGQWVLDTQAAKLYLFPRTDAPAEISAPCLTELVRLEGEEDGQPVRNIVLDGLTFTQGERETWQADDAGLQHDWDMFDKANALVRLRDAENCTVRNCRLIDSGGGGVRLDLHCRHNVIEHNEIARIGGTGVLLCGYGPGTRDVNHHNRVTDNHIHHGGEIYWHAPGIFVWQSGSNLIANNLIHDLGYTGIVVSGVRPHFFKRGDLRECARTIRKDEVGDVTEWPDIVRFLHARHNVVEDNEIHHVMQVLGDGNAIYISGAGEGNIIRRNYCHHLLDWGVQSAIRTDDCQSGTLITQNVIWRCATGGITLKHVNVIENNLIVDLVPRMGPYGDTHAPHGYILLRHGPSQGSQIHRNVFVHRGGEQQFYCEARNKNAPEWARNCDPDYNIYFSMEDRSWSEGYLQTLQREGVDGHSLSVDPKVRDIENGDLRLADDSPAFRLGFRPIDLSKVGRLK